MARKKPLSGAAKRRRAFEKSEAAAAGSKPSSIAALPGALTGPPGALEIDAYLAIGPPPADAIARVEWGARMLAAALYSAACDPELDSGARRRSIGDLGGKLGMTAVKALYEKRFLKLEAALLGTKGGTDGAREGLECLKAP